MNDYKAYITEQLEKIVNIPSPTGYTDAVQDYLVQEFRRLGYKPSCLVKGGIMVPLGGEGNPLTLMAHADTLCAVVHKIKPDGHLGISNLNFHVNAVETECVKVITRFDGEYDGTIQLANPSVHVNPDVSCKRETNLSNLEVVLDERVESAEDVKKLGILPGDVIALNPRFQITKSGFIKSRFLDDKASVACLLAYAKYLKEENVSLPRRVDLLITVFEELGHGGACGIPEDAVEIIAVDMGCVGDGLDCKEYHVCISTKDNSGLYNRKVTNALIQAARENKLSHAIGIYPSGSTDASVALRIGYDVRAGLIGPGVFASHGYERSHIDGLDATLRLLCAYTEKDHFTD